MKRRLSPTWIVILLAVVLGTVTVWSVRRAKESPEVAARRLITVDPMAVESLVFERPGDPPVVIELKPDDWRITSPLAWRADPTAVASLLKELQNLMADERFAKPEEAASYGLGPPQLVLTVKTPDQTTALEFGDTTPVGNGRYVRLAGKNEVYTLSYEKAELLDQDLTQLRDKRIMDIVATDVQRLSFRNAAGSSIVLMRQGDQWQLISPFQDEADSLLAEEFVWGLSFLQTTSFIDKPQNLSTYGLNKPALHIEMVTRNNQGEQTHKLDIGKVEVQPPKDRSYWGVTTTYYVQSSADNKTIYEISTDLSELMSLQAEEFIAKQVFDSAWASRTQQVQLITPDGTWSLKKNGDVWQLVPPRKSPITIERSRVDSLLAAVRAVQLDSVEQKRSTQLPAGGRRWTLQVTGLDGKRRGLVAREASGDAKWLATVEGRQHRYRIDGTLLLKVQEAFAQESK